MVALEPTVNTGKQDIAHCAYTEEKTNKNIVMILKSYVILYI